MKKLNILLSIVAMNFVMIGCGSGGGSSSIENSVPTPTINIVEEEDILSFIRDSYKSKGTYETTEEYNERVVATLEDIKNTTFLTDSILGMSYDADSSTGTVRVRFSHTQDSRLPDLVTSGISYVVAETNSVFTILGQLHDIRTNYEYVFNNFFSPDQLSIEQGEGYCEYTTYPEGAIECLVDVYSPPKEAQNVDIGIKLAVNITSLDVEKREWENYGGVDFVYNYYPASLTSLIIYDRTSGKELGKIGVR